MSLKSIGILTAVVMIAVPAMATSFKISSVAQVTTQANATQPLQGYRAHSVDPLLEFKPYLPTNEDLAPSITSSATNKIDSRTQLFYSRMTEQL
ncbi:hypothetical protein K0504_16000 [Neiella marina]|uniref:Uncharacterized protein n=1 Tax=Neiella holothuriorum TaxID=2870530 RepID=A0ABS7EJL0_9GAMM|nr:hypothetical protein [Neiella holothuriorum]MBW8192543.1 hypothetical protein [Neiella holothuriorum]